jgi:hypothetical protein
VSLELAIANRLKDAIKAILKQRLGRLVINAVLEESLQHFVDRTFGILFTVLGYPWTNLQVGCSTGGAT